MWKLITKTWVHIGSSITDQLFPWVAVAVKEITEFFLYFRVVISCKHHQETSVLENCSKRLDIAVCKYLVRLTPLCLFYCSYLHLFLVSSWNASSFWRSGFSFSLKTQQLFFAIKTNQVWAKYFEPSMKRILDPVWRGFWWWQNPLQEAYDELNPKFTAIPV